MNILDNSTYLLLIQIDFPFVNSYQSHLITMLCLLLAYSKATYKQQRYYLDCT